MAMAVRQGDGQAWPELPWHARAPPPFGESTWSKRLASTGMDQSDSSWEVRAFAADASNCGHWPPRSYSCSFCQREFRTAQALGGHMNVHRRERAHANQVAQRSAAAAAAAVQTAGASHLPAPGPALPGHPRLPSPQPQRLIISGPSSPQLGTSPESTSSGLTSSTGTTQALFFQGMVPIALRDQPLPSSRIFHPHEKHPYCAKTAAASTHAVINLGRFSSCLNHVMGDPHPESVTLDLELRLGQSSSCLE